MINNVSFSVGTGGSLTGTYVSNMYTDKKLVDVVVLETTIEITYRESPTFQYSVVGSNSTPPDRVWKEIYGLKDGKMTLLRVAHGKHIQEQIIPESFEFDDDNSL